MLNRARPVTMRESGVTLIELLIALIILGIGASLAAPSFATALANYRVRASAEAALNGLFLARAEAIRRNTPVSFTLAASGSGWAVAQVAPAATIQSRPDNESPGVVLASSTVSRTVSFVANGMVDTSPAARLEQITITSNVPNTESRRINIFGGGLIRMCDPGIAAAGDSRRC